MQRRRGRWREPICPSVGYDDRQSVRCAGAIQQPWPSVGVAGCCWWVGEWRELYAVVAERTARFKQGKC